MDTAEHVHLRFDQASDDYWTEGYTGLSVKILTLMTPKLKMAKGCLDTLGVLHDYFSNIKIKFYEQLHLHWAGDGGLEDYKTLEKNLREFGSLHNTDKSVTWDSFTSSDQASSIPDAGYRSGIEQTLEESGAKNS